MHEGTARGRPRLPATDDRIMRAALRLMAKHGYARMTVDAVAAEAGVTKPTIYLRFRNKEGLASAALAASMEQIAPAETGDTRTDLLIHLRQFQSGMVRPFGMPMLATVLSEEQGTPALLALYREHVVLPRRALLRAVLHRAQDRSELPDGTDLMLAVDLLEGTFYARYVTGKPSGNDWPESVVDVVLRALHWREQPDHGKVVEVP
jgi:AcrR family transcriptional regulator